MEPTTTRRFHIEPAERLELLRVDPSANPTAAQNVWLYFEPEDGALWFATSCAADNGTPMRVYHNRAYRFSLQPTTDAAVLTEAINAGEYDALFARLANGHSVRWNGSNHVGELTEDAHDAKLDLEEQLWDTPYLLDDEAAGVWDAADWYAMAPPEVPADASDDDLAQFVADLKAEAADFSVVLAGLDNYVTRLRQQAREERNNV